MASWVDDPGPDGVADTPDDTTTAPAEDLDELLADRARWRSRAIALERAGRWAD